VYRRNATDGVSSRALAAFWSYACILFSSEMKAPDGHKHCTGVTLQVLFFTPSYIASNQLGIFTCAQGIATGSALPRCGGEMSSLKLLVVEDDPASLELMTEVFTSLKTDVRPVGDSQEAATLVNKERFDGIFLDIEMPKLNGFELAQMVRQSAWNKSTPIVIVTGREQRDTMYQSFAMGATFFLQKPIDRMKLAGLLRTVQGPMQDNRRRYTRVPMQTAVTCNVGHKILTGMTWNLSQGGMQLEVRDLTPGETLQLSFTLPQPPLGVEASGVVVWAKDERQGIHFTKMSVEHQEIVRDFIAQVGLSPK
jgi:CheY-like chemotaxis protein